VLKKLLLLLLLANLLWASLDVVIGDDLKFVVVVTKDLTILDEEDMCKG
jgi:hypothetical protein